METKSDEGERKRRKERDRKGDKKRERIEERENGRETGFRESNLNIKDDIFASISYLIT